MKAVNLTEKDINIIRDMVDARMGELEDALSKATLDHDIQLFTQSLNYFKELYGRLF
jgi:hypothetical protein